MQTSQFQTKSLQRSSRLLLKNPDRLEFLAETFKVLSDPTRLKIAIALSDHELCVQDIAQKVEVSESAVSHQLRVLRSLRLVKYRREGKQIFYSLDDHHIEQLIQVATEHITER